MDEDTIAEELEEAMEAAEEPEAIEAEDAGASQNGHKRGPGFLMGLFVGIAAGAAVAILSSPSDDEEGALGGLRARFRQAVDEGREAAHEKEAELRSRYDELTQ